MVATSRYVMFGKSDTCQKPNAKYNKRFLDQSEEANDIPFFLNILDN